MGWLNILPSSNELLRSDVKQGYISPEEEELILRLHRILGNMELISPDI